MRPLDSVIPSNVAVPKEPLRAFLGRSHVLETAAEILSLDLPDCLSVTLNGRIFAFDITDGSTAHDGVNCLVSADGRRYKPTSDPTAVVDSRIPANLQIVGTRAALAAATIGAAVNVVVCMGYALAIDRGGAQYVEVANTGPVLAYQVQSNSGTRRWQLREARPHQYHFGAQGGFAGDDAPAFQAFLDYCANTGAEFHAIAGDHNFASTPIARPGPVPDPNYNVYERGPTWRFDNNCWMRATGVGMVAVIQWGNHTYENIIRDGHIIGGVFDCNNIAARGIWATFVNKCNVDNYQVINVPASGAAVQFGTTTLNEFGTLDRGYEGFAQFGRVIGTPTSPLEAARANTHGIRYVNTTDNETFKNVIGGVKVGVWADFASGWDGKHGNHFWNWSENLPMDFGYVLYGDNVIQSNQQDGPFLYGALLLGPGNRALGCNVNYGGQPGDANNVAALWRLEVDATNGTSGELFVSGGTFKATPSKQIAAECSFGPGVPRTAFRKDASNTYRNVNNLEPVSVGCCLSGQVRITTASPTATLQPNSNNVASFVRNAAGNYRITFIRDIPVTLPIWVQVISNVSPDAKFNSYQVLEDTALRTASGTTFYVYRSDAPFTPVDPGGLQFSANSLQ